MKILSIGNSFSQNAQRYLHKMALAEGIELETVNLYIGGCSLQTHWENAQSDLALYQYERNGAPVFREDGTPRYASIREALTQTEWDAVTMQQASHDSGDYSTYQPYLQKLSAYGKELSPRARQLIHQTWAYEIDSAHPAFSRYEKSQQRMYAALRDAYSQAAASIGAPIIPAGDVVQALRAQPPFDYARGGMSLCADGFHMNHTYGEYAVGATWLAVLCGRIPTGRFVPEGCGPEKEAALSVIHQTIARILA